MSNMVHTTDRLKTPYQKLLIPLGSCLNNLENNTLITIIQLSPLLYTEYSVELYDKQNMSRSKLSYQAKKYEE